MKEKLCCTDIQFQIIADMLDENPDLVVMVRDYLEMSI